MIDALRDHTTDWWSSAGTWVGALAALIAAVVAWFQLGGLRDSQRTANIVAIIQVEADLAVAKRQLDAVALSVTESLKKGRGKDKELAESRLRVAAEDYFNILDRICWLAIHGQLNEIDWKEDYQGMIENAVVSISKVFENKDYVKTHYKNIAAVHKLWS
jgi:hypothetical protein